MSTQVFGDIVIKPETRSVFNVIIKKLQAKGWNCIVEDDADWGLIILADKQNKEEGETIRRVKPFYLEKTGDEKRANDLQEKLRNQLVEIHPYKIKWDRSKHKAVKLLPALFAIG